MDSVTNPITIRSGLTGFKLLSTISRMDENSLEGRARFEGAPLFAGIEAMAQLGAMHVRWLCNFKKHGFLLKIERLSFPDCTILDGGFLLKGNLTARSSASFAYNLTAVSKTDVTLSGTFLFSVKAYDHTFKRTDLEAHYKGIFSCLTSE